MDYSRGEGGRECESGGRKYSQHKILLPARLTAAHSNGRALNILHLQGHVCVKFLCVK